MRAATLIDAVGSYCDSTLAFFAAGGDLMLFNVRNGAGLLALTWLVSCGGGSGDPGDPNPPVQPPPIQPPTNQHLALTEVVTVENAVQLTAPANDPRQFIVERSGRVLIRENNVVNTLPFLDIRARTTTNGEGGLLSLAFDPQFSSNGHVYIVYVTPDNVITVERQTVSSSANLADPTSAITIMQIPHPGYTNHYGGMLAFGPDGYLYLSTGDGGGAGDPNRNGQNPLSLLGKILRIDVRGATLAQPFQIPSSNPFSGMSSRRNEIWAMGLRNPWRFSFDGNLIYVADVGQAQREEVNINSTGTGGLNYGWNVMEGSTCYNATTCNAAGLTLPVYEYEHGAGKVNGCSITGGEVYRGTRIAHLAGQYVFSDYCGGYLKSLRYTGSAAPTVTNWSVAKVGGVVSFGKDGSGELYLIAASGKIYRIDSSAVPTGS